MLVLIGLQTYDDSLRPLQQLAAYSGSSHLRSCPSPERFGQLVRRSRRFHNR